MKKVVTMGEIMLRLSTPGYGKIQQAQSFDVIYGGGEANVAMGFSTVGIKSLPLLSKLPDHGHLATVRINSLNQFGVGTEQMVFRRGTNWRSII